MKKILSILLIGVLIIVSGCSSNNVNESKQKTSVLHIAVLAGQQGRNVRPVRVIIGGQQAA